MNLDALDLQIHLETLRSIDNGLTAPDPWKYMRSARLVAEQLSAGDLAILHHLARGQDAALRDLAANGVFNRQGWFADCGASAAAHAMCAFADIWERVTGAPSGSYGR